MRFSLIVQKNRASRCIALPALEGKYRVCLLKPINETLRILFVIFLMIDYRAPVLAAIALIEYGMEPIAAVSFIRERRFI